MKAAAWNPFRLKNMVLMALVLGIAAGIWLGDLFKGFGLGPGEGAGLGPGAGSHESPGQTTTQLISQTGEDNADLVGHHTEEELNNEPEPKPVRGPVKVLIDGRDYFVQRNGASETIPLLELVTLIQRAKPDEDGRRVIIDRTADSRPSAEIKLTEALKSAGISENAVTITPRAVD